MEAPGHKGLLWLSRFEVVWFIAELVRVYVIRMSLCISKTGLEYQRCPDPFGPSTLCLLGAPSGPRF